MDTTPAPGRSAQATYRRLRAEDRIAWRRRLPRFVVTVIMCGAAAGAAVVGLAWLLSGGLHSVVGARLPGSLVRECAATAALAGAVLAGAPALRTPASTRAWAIGADGEAATAAALAPLETEGWAVLHDRRLPGRRANIDHVAVGPGGVWVIETKHWSGRLVVGADRLRRNGRPAEALYDQVWRQAEAVSALLPHVAMPARPVVCVVGGQLVQGRDHAGRRVLGPVEFHTTDSLVRRLRAAPTILTGARVDAIVSALDRALHPA